LSYAVVACGWWRSCGCIVVLWLYQWLVGTLWLGCWLGCWLGLVIGWLVRVGNVNEGSEVNRWGSTVVIVIMMMMLLPSAAEASWWWRLIKRSVFSEAFLFLGRVRPQGGRAVNIIWILPMKVVAFLDLTCTDRSLRFSSSLAELCLYFWNFVVSWWWH